MSIQDITDKLNDAANRAEAASLIMQQVANADSSTEIPTDSGPTPSIKRWLNHLEQYVDSSLQGRANQLDFAKLSYASKSAADAAAVFLPNGQQVSAEGFDYEVNGGLLESKFPTPSLGSVQTIADLRGQQTPSGPCSIYVSGYWSINDGGGGTFNWIPSSIKNDNGGTVIKPTSLSGAGRWEKNVSTIRVKEFGIKADGTNERSKLQSLFDAFSDNFIVDFQNLPIYVGAISESTGNIFSFSNRSGITFINPGKFSVDNNFTLSDTNVDWRALFRFTNCDNLNLDVNAKGSTYNKEYPKGVLAVEIQTSQSDTKTRNYRVTSVCENGHAPLEFNRPFSELASKTAIVGTKINAQNIELLTFAKNCEYGVRFIRNGVEANGFVATDNVTRSYFPSDTWGHTIDVVSKNHEKFTDILIKSYFDDVFGIKVRYSGKNFSLASDSICTLEFQNDDQSTSIRGVRVEIDCDNLTEMVNSPIVINSQVSAAGIGQATTNSVIDDIFLSYSTGQIYTKDTINVKSFANKSGIVNISGNFANCTNTRGLTFIRGNTLISNNSGDYSAGKNLAYFYVKGFVLEQAAFINLDVYCDANFADSDSPEAYQRWSGRLAVGTNGSCSIANLVKDQEKLFNTAVSPVVTAISGSGNYLLKFSVANSTCNNANARLHCRLTIIGNSI